MNSQGKHVWSYGETKFRPLIMFTSVQGCMKKKAWENAPAREKSRENMPAREKAWENAPARQCRHGHRRNPVQTDPRA